MTLALSQPGTPTRASTGLGVFSKIRSHGSLLNLQRPESQRASSYGTPGKTSPRSSLFSIPAKEGAGVKARQLSTQLQVDLYCETIELADEFVSASKIGRPKKCGSGASAACVKIMVRKDDKHGQQFAVKEFRKPSVKETEDEYIAKVKSEYTISKALSHPNVVKSVCLATHHGRWNHVMEFCSQGDVFSLLEKGYFRNEDRYCIFKQVLRGIAYLHECGIAHRDVKLENCLMMDNGCIKITDFGVSEVALGDHPGLESSRGKCGCGDMTNIKRSKSGIVGSKPYIAPEVLSTDKEYDSMKFDVWSCGILFLTLMHGGNPWQCASQNEPNYRLFTEGWGTFLENDPGAFVDEHTHPQCGTVFTSLTNSQQRCVLRMLHPDPGKRCTIQEALCDRWVKVIECCSPDPDLLLDGIDVSKNGCEKVAAKMKVQSKHNHLPPQLKRSSFIQHRFDLGSGTSRYD